MTFTLPHSKPKYDVWRQVNCVGWGSPLKKKQACQRQGSVKTSDFLSTMQQWNSTKTLKYLVVVFDPVAAVGGKQEENERRPKSGATSATTWHQVQGPPWLLCDFFLDFFSPTFLCLAESSKTVLIPFVKVWEEAEEWQQLGVGRQLAAVAFVRRPFSLQLDLQLEPTSTATSSPRSSNSNTRLCTRPSWPPCPTMAYSGPVIDVRVGLNNSRLFPFSSTTRCVSAEGHWF